MLKTVALLGFISAAFASYAPPYAPGYGQSWSPTSSWSSPSCTEAESIVSASYQPTTSSSNAVAGPILSSIPHPFLPLPHTTNSSAIAPAYPIPTSSGSSTPISPAMTNPAESAPIVYSSSPAAPLSPDTSSTIFESRSPAYSSLSSYSASGTPASSTMMPLYSTDFPYSTTATSTTVKTLTSIYQSTVTLPISGLITDSPKETSRNAPAYTTSPVYSETVITTETIFISTTVYLVTSSAVIPPLPGQSSSSRPILPITESAPPCNTPQPAIVTEETEAFTAYCPATETLVTSDATFTRTYSTNSAIISVMPVQQPTLTCTQSTLSSSVSPRSSASPYSPIFTSDCDSNNTCVQSHGTAIPSASTTAGPNAYTGAATFQKPAIAMLAGAVLLAIA